MPLNVVYRTRNNGEREVIDQKGETPEVLGKKKPSEQKEPKRDNKGVGRKVARMSGLASRRPSRPRHFGKEKP